LCSDLLGARRNPITVTPEDYSRWRRSRLGAITEAREAEVIFGAAGPVESRRLLDVGCGDGTYAIEGAFRGALVTAIDASQDMIDAARRRSWDRDVTIDYRVADVQALPFESSTFDLVIAVTVLCFVSDAGRAIREMARVLAPGGRLVIGELNRWNTWAAWRRLRAWFGSPTWRGAVFRSPGQLHGLLQRAGLTVNQIQGAVYYLPIGLFARLMAPAEQVLSATTTIGAAFLAATATKTPTHGRGDAKTDPMP